MASAKMATILPRGYELTSIVVVRPWMNNYILQNTMACNNLSCLNFIQINDKRGPGAPLLLYNKL